jgi:hypothetical protein
MEDTQVDTLDIANFYRSATSDLRHRDDGNDRRGRSPKFEIFVAVEACTTTESNNEYPLGEGKLIGDELCNRAFLIASETNMDPSSSC